MINPVFNSYVRRIATRAVALILASLAVGAFFNAASPLGFPLVKPPAKPPANEGAPERGGTIQPDTPHPAEQKPGEEGSAAPAEPASGTKLPVQPSAIYSNEPLSVRVLPGTPGETEPPAAPAAGNPYSNQSLEAKPPAPQPGKGVYGGGTVAEPVPPAKPGKESAPDGAAEPAAVTWPEAKEMLRTGEAVLVDARPIAAFKAGSIPGAVSLPASSIKDEMPEFMKRFDTNRWLIVYCGDKGCASSEEVARMLMKEYGYRHVFHMPGGYAEWQIAEAGRKTDEKKQ